ncbi:MAG: ferritin-like domain-containing protein, partial [Deltaproteobacteria bacterium]|nr:ferritin-like domain-containing protein [Deltaproteobacteria bacterium]
PDAGSWADCDPQTQYFVGGYGCEPLGGGCSGVTEAYLPQGSPLIGPRGGISPDDCRSLCSTANQGGSLIQCHVPLDASGSYATDGGADVVECYWQYGCTGRQPEGFAMPEAQPGLGGYLASMAALEAASVPAFRRLARELSALGAPEELCARARQAALEEIDHTRTMRALAEGRGGIVVAPELGPERLRSTRELAVENAVEGCVRETFGAALALWQSRAARDPELRQAFARIAEDEASHAELSWDVAAFLEERLTAEELEATQAARAAAIRELEGQLALGQPLAYDDAAGIPPPALARALFESVASEVWGGLAS